MDWIITFARRTISRPHVCDDVNEAEQQQRRRADSCWEANKHTAQRSTHQTNCGDNNSALSSQSLWKFIQIRSDRISLCWLCVYSGYEWIIGVDVNAAVESISPCTQNCLSELEASSLFYVTAAERWREFILRSLRQSWVSHHGTTRSVSSYFLERYQRKQTAEIKLEGQ